MQHQFSPIDCNLRQHHVLYGGDGDMNAAIGGAPGERVVLDSKQLARIEAVHRGFLYQHLYAAACLLKLHALEGGAVLIERDEDIECETPDAVYFLQVKTRQNLLMPSDLAGVLMHFSELREEHSDKVGERSVVFAIVSNQPPGPKLTAEIESWPDDVHFICPGRTLEDHPFLPEATADLNDAINYTRTLAEPLPFRSLQPDTLVWKLAAKVQFAATGADRADHSISRIELPNLFESYVDQLQEFPEVPDTYRPQENEPPLISGEGVRLIVGFSGAGKTLWAASHASHTPEVVGYFDICDLPDTALASSLARELAARMLTGGPGDTARLPAGTGMELLAALNRHIDASQSTPVMVLDNVHRCRPEVIRDIIACCSNVRFVLLGQPGDHIARFEVHLGVSAEELSGWSMETIASVFAEKIVPISPAIARRWHTVTGGLPLFVESAARVCHQTYGGDVEKFLAELEAGSHAQPVAQEVLLEEVLDTLNTDERAVLSVLSLTRLSLDPDEIGHIVECLPSRPDSSMRVLRELSRSGLVQRFANGKWKVHDAVTIPARSLLDSVSPDLHLECLVRLRDVLFQSLQARPDIARLSAWMRLLAPTGRTEVLADVAMEEMFHEYGDPTDLKLALEALAADPDAGPESEYWALEALAFWDLQSDARVYDPGPRLTRMQAILDEHPGIDPDGPLRIGIKTMMSGGARGDAVVVHESYNRCRAQAEGYPSKLRLVRYNYAAALHTLGENRKALPIAETLYAEYYDVLDILPADVLGATNQRMRELVADIEEAQSDLKHLADCLSLTGKIKRALGEHPRLLAIHAAKFYFLVGAWRSQMKVAQEFADDCLDLGDTEAAVIAMENHVLPLMTAFQFDGEYMDVYSHYAVLLAYNGKIVDARRQMAQLEPFISTLPEAHQAGLANQRELIEQIAVGEIRAPERRSPLGGPDRAVRQRHAGARKIGRNELCPCGSGRKYKKCCLNG
ncbi:AAA family ATPase [Hyphomonas sp.]|uniref:AAA family ATPase n=1 Tax=Hyphomonas sp. TaxID=87 RepID=UPI0030019884